MLEGHLPRVIYHQVYNVYEDYRADISHKRIYVLKKGFSRIYRADVFVREPVGREEVQPARERFRPRAGLGVHPVVVHQLLRIDPYLREDFSYI
jgi:hypothetical protein